MNSTDVWKKALSFHARNFGLLLPIFPLLFVPIVSDALHTILIGQMQEGRIQQRSEMVLKAFQAVPKLLGMKLYFWGAAVLWAFVPVYGWIKEIDYRLAWGMASNVLLLEGTANRTGIARCYEIIEKPEKGSLIRSLFTIPSMGLFCLACISVIPTSAMYWGSVLLILWVSIPVSAAANTYCYVQLRGVEE